MRHLFHLLVVLALLAAGSTAVAGDEAKSRSHCNSCTVKCPNCCHTCVFSAEKGKETKSCYDVQCKDICIPRVTFPWQKNCCTCGKGGNDGKDGCCAVHNGAKSKSVRVLKKYEYECSKCSYKWTPSSDKDGLKDKLIGDEPAIEPEAELEAAPTPAPPAVEARMSHGKPVVSMVSSSR